MEYRKDIDGLRAIAVLPVVLYHAGIPGFSGGFVGVDIFFVISGFLITGILHKDLAEGRFSLATFYERRARRILPALFVVVATCLAAGVLLLLPDMLVGLARSALATMMFASNVWFWFSTSDYFAPSAGLEPLLHTWSLAVEEQFYIVLPLLLWWLYGRPRRAVLGALVGLCIFSFLLSVWATGPYPQESFYFAPTRAWELGLGVLLALGVFPACRNAYLVEAIALSGIAAIFIAVALYSAATPFPGIAAALPCFGALALLWSGEQRQTAVARILSSPVPVAIGLVSYSLYLWHWPIIVYFRLTVGTLDLPYAQASLAIGLSFACAFASWRLVERPFRRRPPIGISRQRIFASALAGAAVLSVVSAVVDLREGFPERLPQDVRLAYAGSRDIDARRGRCDGKLPKDGLCRIEGEASSPSDRRNDVLLWGDSHAGALLSGLDFLMDGRKRGGAVAFKGACPPILGVQRVDQKHSGDCVAFNAAIMAMLEQSDDFPIVVLSARWPLAANGKRYPGETGRPAILDRLDFEEASLGTAGNYAIFKSEFLRTVREIRDTGRRVVIVDGIPEIGWSVPHALGLHRLIDADLPPPPTRQAVDARSAKANSVLAIADEDLGVQRVSAVPLLCNPVCAVEKNGIPLYSDDDHLSVYGAMTIVPRMFKDLMPSDTNRRLRPG
ncbi:acyltransferase family protein [Sinorhizobium meliloti]|uniref:acyltransferase family protein n=1 Tax=Rhizobium meliloti TaxID=382 RepID=UPI00398CB1E4